MAQQHLLTLDTLIVRNTVKIDGVDYELKSMNEFAAPEAHRLARLSRRIDTLFNRATELSASEEAELKLAVDGVCAAILLAPEDVLAKLTDMMKVRIFKVFSELEQAQLQPARAAAQPAQETNGTN